MVVESFKRNQTTLLSSRSPRSGGTVSPLL